jgi:hypothetical protein
MLAVEMADEIRRRKLNLVEKRLHLLILRESSLRSELIESDVS